MVTLSRPVELGPPLKSQSHVLPRSLDAVHGLVHPHLGQSLALHSDLVLLGAPKEGIEVAHFLVNLPPLQLVGAGLPVLLRDLVADFLCEAVHLGGLL
jgi:hypothetical protein